MAQEVFFSVCHGSRATDKDVQSGYNFTPAVLDDYCRHRVLRADYPGIIAEEGHSVLGIYATGLTANDVRLLDYFEGPEYDKVKVKVTLADRDGNKKDGEVKDTTAYVFRNPDHLVKTEWDFEEFKSQKMKAWTRGDWAFDDGADA